MKRMNSTHVEHKIKYNNDCMTKLGRFGIYYYVGMQYTYRFIGTRAHINYTICFHFE